MPLNKPTTNTKGFTMPLNSQQTNNKHNEKNNRFNGVTVPPQHSSTKYLHPSKPASINPS